MKYNLLLERLRSTKVMLIEHYWPQAANTVNSAIKEIERLHAENEALRKDAERYRFIRDESNSSDFSVTDYSHFVIYDAALDDAIDYEMEKAK